MAASLPLECSSISPGALTRARGTSMAASFPLECSSISPPLRDGGQRMACSSMPSAGHSRASISPGTLSGLLFWRHLKSIPPGTPFGLLIPPPFPPSALAARSRAVSRHLRAGGVTPSTAGASHLGPMGQGPWPPAAAQARHLTPEDAASLLPSKSLPHAQGSSVVGRQDGGALCHVAHCYSQSTTATVIFNPAQGNSRRVCFCSKCGAPTERRVPEGDDKDRDVCAEVACGLVHYENPKVVVGAVCLWEDKILLCRRAIEPCRGLWGFPQGFMEMGETTREGAVREALEEAGAHIRVKDLLAVYNIPNQVQLIYLADLLSPDVAPGPESLDAVLFSSTDIPFEQLAFPTVKWALEYLLSAKFQSSGMYPQQRTKVVKFDDSGKFIPGLYEDD